MSGSTLPAEVYRWQCETCHRVMEYVPSYTHMKPLTDRTSRPLWCTGKVNRFTYRLVTRSDYVLRA